MGAEYTEMIFIGSKRQVRAKFRRVCEQDAYDYGHAGYTGTFAEKDDIEFVPPPPRRKFWKQDEAAKHCQDTDKWGPAQAYQLGPKKWLLAGMCST